MTHAPGIVDLTLNRTDVVEAAAALLRDAFQHRTSDWQDLVSARQEVTTSVAPEKISRVWLDGSGRVLGWIGAIPSYDGRVWEIHPLVVAQAHRRQGIGRALVIDVERLVEARGGLTLWAGSDDENDETSLSGADLYVDTPGAIRDIKNLRGHPYEFYLRLGFRVTGVLPDANGRGKPDIFLAKRIGADMPVVVSEFRRAQASDVAGIARAHRDSIQSIGPAFYPPNVVDDWSEGLTGDLYLRAMEGGEVFFIATDTSGDSPLVLGFASAYQIEGSRHGTSVYVRGSAARRGIGSALFAMAEAHAVTHGAASIDVEASLAGVEFYRANGFTEIGRGETRLTSGRPIACVFMRKLLPGAADPEG